MRMKKKISKPFELPKEKNTGHWTQEEHSVYLKFLLDHKALEANPKKKNNKIFKLMALTIGSRSPSQCRF
jgi:hypothetical protein